MLGPVVVHRSEILYPELGPHNPMIRQVVAHVSQEVFPRSAGIELSEGRSVKIKDAGVPRKLLIRLPWEKGDLIVMVVCRYGRAYFRRVLRKMESTTGQGSENRVSWLGLRQIEVSQGNDVGTVAVRTLSSIVGPSCDGECLQTAAVHGDG